MQATARTRTAPLPFIRNIMEQGGPEPVQYEKLNRAFDALHSDLQSGLMNREDLLLLQEGFSEECLQQTIHGHALSRPYGYAGDFMIIDKLYRRHVTPDARFATWDRNWHSLSAAQAVRNRKDYFIRCLGNRVREKGNTSLLNVASGPARDLSELYRAIDPTLLSTTCVEADAAAIDYARGLNKEHAAQVQFVQQNIFRFRSEAQYDIVWSAGLFDYFEDDVFIRLLRRFMGWTKAGGEVIVGNFNVENPTRTCMELVGDWYLHHRTAEDLRYFALRAGAAPGQIRVDQEEEGINLFLHISM